MVAPNTVINHIGLVLDASSSMERLTSQTVQIADLQTQHLAQRSKELDQETRITVYKFNDQVECLFYDKDVLRLPSMKGQFRPSGMTALLDATLQCIHDLEATATLYGDHAFLIYVLTDGEENRSKPNAAALLRDKLQRLPDNWTIAVLVPNQHGVFEAKRFGFPANNIAVWDTSAKGIAEVGEKIRAATDNYMTLRGKGSFRGTKNLFDVDVTNLTPHVVGKVLDEVQPLSIPVDQDARIDDTIKAVVGSYTIGTGYYQLTKSEDVQPQKSIILRDKRTQKFYTGPSVRSMLGLPDASVRIAPVNHPQYDIFVQSTSVNRKLLSGSTVLYYP